MTPAEAIAALGIEVTAQFVPFSASRNAKEATTASDLSLNWKVTIGRNGKPFLTTDYMQGIGHAPAHKANAPLLGHANSMLRFEALKAEAETGRRYMTRSVLSSMGKPLDEPSAADVLYSLISDASALDYPRFEDWADDLGFDHDSRNAGSIYQACLATGLKLRAANGVGIDSLPDAPRFRFIPRADLPRSPFDSSPAALPRDSFTNGLPCGEPSKRGSVAFKPKPKHIKNWNPPRSSLDPHYTIAMAGDDPKLTKAREAYAGGDPQPLRDYLRAEANRRAADAAAVEPFQYALAA